MYGIEVVTLLLITKHDIYNEFDEGYLSFSNY